MSADSLGPRRIFLGPSAFLPRVGFVTVPIVPPHRLPDTTLVRSALIGYAGGALRAYANLCRHLAIALDYGDGDVSDEGDHGNLRCRRHGAVFEATSGLCVVGPCLGLSLWPLRVEVDEVGDATLVLAEETQLPGTSPRLRARRNRWHCAGAAPSCAGIDAIRLMRRIALPSS